MSATRADMVRGIGRWDLVALMINITIGSGILGLPAKVFGLTGVYSILALFLCALVNVPSSFMLVIQIAVNHEVPETMNKVEAGVPIDWGVHQVLTSHNFAVNSLAALHFSGGLNMQIEHHLFPSVHSSHYPALAPIVKRACEEFDLPYNTSCSLWAAMAKHYRILQMNSVP